MKTFIIVLFLITLPISAQSAPVTWTMKFSQPISPDSQETHITGEGSFSYDPDTLSSAEVHDDATFVKVFYGPGPDDYRLTNWSETKAEINTQLTRLNINLLGHKFDHSHFTIGRRHGTSDWWWPDSFGKLTHDMGHKTYVGTGGDSYFSTGWMFQESGKYAPSKALALGVDNIDSSTASGHWIMFHQQTSTRTLGTWTACVDTDQPASHADCNRDGVINIMDVVCTINKILAP